MLRGVRVPDEPPANQWDDARQLPDGWRRFRRPATTTGRGRIAVLRRRLQDFTVDGYQELLAHFGEASTTEFMIKHVEYGGHDRTPS